MDMRRRTVTKTTGPFMVPGSLPTDGLRFPDTLLIALKNPSSRVRFVRIVVDRCPIPFPSREQNLIDVVQPLPPESCDFVTATGYAPGDILNVFIMGDLDRDEDSVLVSVVGRNTAGTTGSPAAFADDRHEPTMFFRHEDLVRINDDDKDDEED